MQQHPPESSNGTPLVEAIGHLTKMDEPQYAEPVGGAERQEKSRFPISLPIAESLSNVHECSYLEGRTASLPLKLPSRLLTDDEFDEAMAGGLRRSGIFLYHTACKLCSACEPSRVDVSKFVWRDSFKRVLKRGDRSLQIALNRPSLDARRLQLFNLHRSQRGLGDPDGQYRPEDYQNFLVDSCLTQSMEWSFSLDGDLMGVSIVDFGRIALSAVYTYFAPQHSKFSLGTYSVLKQIEFARDSGMQYAYLGLYVAENKHLNYKARFTPQERWIAGNWVEFT